MPGDNPDAYRKMYEMGMELQQLAKDGGYDPEEGMSDSDDSYSSDSEVTEEYPETSKKDKVGAALSYM